MEPAKRIVDKLGGPTAVSRILGLHRTAIYHWLRPRALGGANGMVPSKYIERLIRHARAHNIKLTPRDFAMRLDDEK